MRYFHDYTIRPGTRKGYTYRKQGLQTLDQEAVTTFRVMLGEHADENDWTDGVPVEGLSHIQVRLTRPGPGVAFVTFGLEHDDSETPEVRMLPVTTSAIIAEGVERELAARVMGQLGLVWNATWGRHGIRLPAEPPLKFPALVSMVLPTAELAKDDLPIIADMETCLAAAFFDGQPGT